MTLSPPDRAWFELARTEIARWQRAVPGLVAIHHIGSTAVPGLAAKPVIDLLPVFGSAAAMDYARGRIEGMGYAWLGEHGLDGRRYCRRDDPGTGQRLVQAHAYVTRHPDITRHIAFRNLLRGEPGLRDAYAAEKTRCAALHPEDGAAYSACKSAWIDMAEARAVRQRWDRR